MAYYRIDEKGTLRIYEYTEDPSTFSGYSSVLAHSITLEELVEEYKENGFKLSFEKIEETNA